jgi:hypothetical protein
MFTLGRPEFPVDTHVLRLALALGWLPRGTGREAAYAHLNQRVPDAVKYDLHVLLVLHGKVYRNDASMLRRALAAAAGAPTPSSDATEAEEASGGSGGGGGGGDAADGGTPAPKRGGKGRCAKGPSASVPVKVEGGAAAATPHGHAGPAAGRGKRRRGGGPGHAAVKEEERGDEGEDEAKPCALAGEAGGPAQPDGGDSGPGASRRRRRASSGAGGAGPVAVKPEPA